MRTLALSPVYRARAFISSIPGAVSGAGGHNATFAVACKLVEFGLSPSEHGRCSWNSTIRRRLKAACETLELGHVTPHGLRSYFVTRARESGLSDAEIAMLIGDKTGPAIIAHTYGDVRPEHLLTQAKRIRLTATQSESASNQQGSPASSIKSSNTTPCIATGLTLTQNDTLSAEDAEFKAI